MERIEGIRFASPEGVDLHADVHLPRSAGDGSPVPCCVWLHGGGWLRGSRSERVDERIVPLAEHGIAVVAVDYRVSTEAVFPAQVADVRSAVRWVRSHGAEYGFDSSAVGLWGASAGGHLAALAALTRDPEDEHLGDSTVQAAACWFPPTDLVAMEAETPEHPLPGWFSGPLPKPSFPARLLGAEAVTDVPELARAASPLAHVDAEAPPFLLVHGDRDGMVPDRHSRRLHEALRAQGGDSTLLIVEGANHEDAVFDGPAVLGATAGFLISALRRHD